MIMITFMIIFIRTFTQQQNLYLLEKVTPIVILYLKIRILYILYMKFIFIRKL